MNKGKSPKKTRLINRSIYEISFNKTFEEVCDELKEICEKLFILLPDKTLSPDERLERLARVVPEDILISANHQTGRAKLNKLTGRLNALVPDRSLRPLEKINFLVDRLHELVPTEEKRIFKKLEVLGDFRISDIGR